MSLKIKIIIGLAILLVGGGVIYRSVLSGKKTAIEYQTARVEKGTLITSVTASGSIASPLEALVKQSQAWSSYLAAKNQLESAKSRVNTLQAAEFAANQKFINDAVARNLKTDDPTYIQEKATWLAAEADYVNQTGVIKQAEIAVASAWYSYQQVVAGLTTPVAMAKGEIWAVVNLSEMDVVKVAVGQKVSLTLDAYPNKSFTGKILSINTNGLVSSGVTSYPTTIIFDRTTEKVYPNMAVTAKIITSIKDNVVLIPAAAVQTPADGGSAVRILVKGQPQTVEVVTGAANDTETEIVSGLSEGQEVVTGTVNQGTATSGNQGASLFGGNIRGSFGGGAVGGGMFRSGGR